MTCTCTSTSMWQLFLYLTISSPYNINYYTLTIAFSLPPSFLPFFPHSIPLSSIFLLLSCFLAFLLSSSLPFYLSRQFSYCGLFLFLSHIYFILFLIPSILSYFVYRKSTGIHPNKIYFPYEEKSFNRWNIHTCENEKNCQKSKRRKNCRISNSKI